MILNKLKSMNKQQERDSIIIYRIFIFPLPYLYIYQDIYTFSSSREIGLATEQKKCNLIVHELEVRMEYQQCSNCVEFIFVKKKNKVKLKFYSH